MREIVLDTETTGLDPHKGDRVVEIGAVELVNHIPSGRTYHQYINPERDMPQEAFAVHGLSESFLSDKPVFADIAPAFFDFITGGMLVIHNASFDVGFLNAELTAAGHATIPPEQVLDTLALARNRHPMGPNSLDALCKRYGIDNSKRTKHGALLDSELLAEVYLELIGGRQTTLTLVDNAVQSNPEILSARPANHRSVPLPGRLSDEERRRHADMIEELGENALWRRLS